MLNDNPELRGHITRNEQMWKIWLESGVSSETEMTVNFHFYSAKPAGRDSLCAIFEKQNIPFRVSQTRTLIFFKGWRIEADISKKWVLAELQAETRNMFILSKQVGVLLEGCGAFMPGGT